MNTPAIAIIGAGNMGASLIGGLIKDGHPNDKLVASDLSEEKLTYLQEKFHIRVTTSNIDAAKTADVIVFAIKPPFFSTVAKELKPIIAERKPLVISIAAGIRATSIKKWLGDTTAIVRAMPNTPALIGCGATGLYANDNVTSQEHSLAESILRAVGVVVWLTDETLLDTVTALSGSGPAYFFLMMEAMQKAGEALGLSPETARLLTIQTALGAASMAMESDKTLSQLRHDVTSPGGTTEKALAVLERNQFEALIKETLEAAKLRSEELANLFTKNN